MTLYIYYNGHTNTWVVTETDPGPGRVLRMYLSHADSDADLSLNFHSGEEEVEILR